ncbi:biliverdin-producing heme oxygenase [Halomonadaceae bacterium KBTZ08]
MTTNAASSNANQGDTVLTTCLREETRPEHDRIEAALDIPDSIREPTDYVRLLAGFYTFYQPLEQQLLRLDWQGSDIDMEARRKAPLLARDLEACGTKPEGLTFCSQLPPLRDATEGLGCLYVLEGATLGGEVIHRRLHTGFGSWLENRDRFYRCYGDERGHMWRAFKQAANHFGQACDPADQSRTIDTARTTFRLLQAWLERR